MDINTILNKVNQLKGVQTKLQTEKSKSEELLLSKLELQQNIEQAQIIIQQVGKQTQEQIKFHIEDIVSLAIDSIFPDTYKFGLNFDIKRNKTEVEICFYDENNTKINPMDSTGGGIIDITSFALRVAMWSLKTGKKNNTIILDEPMKFLSRDLAPKGAELLKKLSEKLNIQFILSTHNQDLIEFSDRVFEVKKINNISKVGVL